LKTIMLVDDSATVLLSISGILAKAGFKVVTANSAEDGQKTSPPAPSPTCSSPISTCPG
jgi:two-component system chemotaxis response regulator CheY